jgi:hypothetical protein
MVVCLKPSVSSARKPSLAISDNPIASLPNSLAEYFRLTARALVVVSDPPREVWTEAGRTLSKVARASKWWIGDWLRYGEEKAYISKGKYDRAVAATGIPRRTLQQYSWVAGAYESSRRREDLTFRHHTEAAALPEPERSALLEQAAKAKWSVSVLRRKVAACKQAAGALPSQSDSPNRGAASASGKGRYRGVIRTKHATLAHQRFSK